MNRELKRNIMGEALKKWGTVKQIDMVTEECAELIQALCHYKRKRIRKGKVIEEMVDVTIMIEQMLVMFKITPLEFQLLQDSKWRRLATRLGVN